jgi:rhodanese-related sulfurtransferase
VPNRTSTAGKILLEAVAVALAGAAFAFAANELSPRGLELARNYFPGAAKPSLSPPKLTPPPPAETATNQDPAAAEIDQRLKDKGLQPIDRLQTERLFRDPRYEQGLVVFVDARDEEDYRQGHIPGAYELNPYYPERQLNNVLLPCQFAAQVVVYCTGGDCEDADSTAILLRDAGIPNQKLFVYGGGFTEWAARHLPVEQGARNSAVAQGQSK